MPDPGTVGPVSKTRHPTLEALLDARFSCRAYLDGPVPRPIIERLLRSAQRAPSWCNTQPWQVVVTEGEGTERFRDALSAHAGTAGDAAEPDVPMPAEYHGVYLDRRREVGWQLYESVGITRGDRGASERQAALNFTFLGAPHVAVITADASQGTYGALDTGVYVGTFLLAAQSLGLGAIAQAAIAMHGSFVHQHLAIPTDRVVLLGISFGWPDLGHPANSFRSTRADLGDTVQWVSR